MITDSATYFDGPVHAPECPECGGTVDAEWTFCPWCGERIDWERVEVR